MADAAAVDVASAVAGPVASVVAAVVDTVAVALELSVAVEARSLVVVAAVVSAVGTAFAVDLYSVVAAEIAAASELVECASSSFRYYVLAAADAISVSSHRCTRQTISPNGTVIPRVVLPFEATFSTNLVEHWVFVASTSGH